MTRMSATIWLSLCLALSGCSTPAPKPPTPSLGVKAPACPLTPCLLPGRKAPANSEDWPLALDATEDALESCAVQVLDCIKRQSLPLTSLQVTP